MPNRLLAALLIAGALAACSEGPAERTGRKLDNVGSNVRDAVDPPKGPSERIGRAVDRAVN